MTAKKIITHHGNAHLDDFLSCCLLLHKDPEIKKIERKDPTEEELEDETSWVLDIGGRLEPLKNNFDHHQENIRECTLSLLLKNWNIWEKAIKVHSFLEIAVLIDSQGQYKTLKELNLPNYVSIIFSSFLEISLLRLFSKKSVIHENSVLYKLMKYFGSEFFKEISDYEETIQLVDKFSEVKKLRDVPVIQYYGKITNTMERLIKEKKKELFGRGGIGIFPNNRPKGTIAVQRYDEDKRVDFTRLPKDKRIRFIHSSGFLAIFDPMSNYELEQLILEAIRKK
ncbi:MAG: MYG1 family protein [Promethearchaeota archaeon]